MKTSEKSLTRRSVYYRTISSIDDWWFVTGFNWNKIQTIERNVCMWELVRAHEHKTVIEKRKIKQRKRQGFRWWQEESDHGFVTLHHSLPTTFIISDRASIRSFFLLYHINTRAHNFRLREKKRIVRMYVRVHSLLMECSACAMLIYATCKLLDQH
mgnify:CR=1 FL=1